MLVARRENRLRVISENAKRIGANHAIFVAADVVKEDECRRFVNEAITVFGRSMTHSPSYAMNLSFVLNMVYNQRCT